MKWTSEAGPRQTKAVNKALQALQWAGKSHVEIMGVVGGEESRHVLTNVFGGVRSEVVEMMDAIHERYEGKITRENHKAVIKAFQVATADATANMPEEDSRRTPEAVAEQVAIDTKYADEHEDAQRIKAKNHKALMAKAPAEAKAIIVAEEEIDDCDTQADYFNIKIGRRVAIGWRTGKREDFRQLRQAAATFEHTAHMGPGMDVYTVRAVYAAGEHSYPHLEAQRFTTEEAAKAYVEDHKPSVDYKLVLECDSVEHRDNYSMGGGNYLKAAHCYSSGWKVKSYPLPLEDWMSDFEDGLSEPVPAATVNRERRKRWRGGKIQRQAQRGNQGKSKGPPFPME